MTDWTDADERDDLFERGAYDPVPDEAIPERRTARCRNEACAFFLVTFVPNGDQDVCLACFEPLEEEWT